MHFWRSPLSGSAISKIVSPPRASLIVQIHGAPSVPAEGGRSLLPLHGLGRSIRGPGVGHAAQRRAGQRKVRAVRFWLPVGGFYLAVRLWLGAVRRCVSWNVFVRAYSRRDRAKGAWGASHGLLAV